MNIKYVSALDTLDSKRTIRIEMTKQEAEALLSVLPAIHFDILTEELALGLISALGDWVADKEDQED